MRNQTHKDLHFMLAVDRRVSTQPVNTTLSHKPDTQSYLRLDALKHTWHPNHQRWTQSGQVIRQLLGVPR